MNSSSSSICGGGHHNSISGGYNNIINNNGFFNHIIGGVNTILGTNNNNIIGSSNCVPLNCDAVNIFGINMTANRSCATFVNNLSIMSIPTSSAGLPAGSVWNDGGFLKIV